jgi:hypothetical protein
MSSPPETELPRRPSAINRVPTPVAIASLGFHQQFATSNPCAAGAPPRMKKCYTTWQEEQRQRSMIHSCCEPGHQYDRGCLSSTTVCRSPVSAKHVEKILTHAWLPVVLSMKKSSCIRWKSFCHRLFSCCFSLVFVSSHGLFVLLSLFQRSIRKDGDTGVFLCGANLGSMLYSTSPKRKMYH